MTRPFFISFVRYKNLKSYSYNQFFHLNICILLRMSKFSLIGECNADVSIGGVKIQRTADVDSMSPEDTKEPSGIANILDTGSKGQFNFIGKNKGSVKVNNVFIGENVMDTGSGIRPITPEELERINKLVEDCGDKKSNSVDQFSIIDKVGTGGNVKIGKIEMNNNKIMN